MLARAGNREALLVEQLLDAQHALDVALAVHALSRAALDRLQLRELGLPEAQHVGGQMAQRGHFSDAEIKLVGDEDFIRFVLRRAFLPRSHLLSRGRAASFAYCDTGPAGHRIRKEFRDIVSPRELPARNAGARELMPNAKKEKPLKRCFS